MAKQTTGKTWRFKPKAKSETDSVTLEFDGDVVTVHEWDTGTEITLCAKEAAEVVRKLSAILEQV